MPLVGARRDCYLVPIGLAEKCINVVYLAGIVLSTFPICGCVAGTVRFAVGRYSVPIGGLVGDVFSVSVAATPSDADSTGHRDGDKHRSARSGADIHWMDIWLEKVKLESDYSIGRIFRSNREKRTAVHGVAGILADTGVRGSRRRLMEQNRN